MAKDPKEIQKEFEELLLSTNRPGVEGLIEDLHSFHFFEAPASAGHHLNVAGGLALHSLNVCRAALAIYESLLPLEPSLRSEVSRESLIIASLLHDLCKTDIYVRSVKKKRNNLGQWEDAEGYRLSFRNFPMGHGEKSLVMALLSGLELSDAEMLAIRWHMGAFGLNQNSTEELKNYDAARKLYPLVSIVQTADSLAAAVLERESAEIDDL